MGAADNRGTIVMIWATPGGRGSAISLVQGMSAKESVQGKRGRKDRADGISADCDVAKENRAR